MTPLFFFTRPPSASIYTLSLHDALPISGAEAYLPLLEALDALLRSEGPAVARALRELAPTWHVQVATQEEDRKSTRLNSSHVSISYAVFCLKKKIGYDPPDPT